MSPVLSVARPDDILVVQKWFTTAKEVEFWAGPNFTFSLDNSTNYELLTQEKYQSFCLKIESEILAFGQYQLAHSLLHLARLVVAPNRRGQGVATLLINALIARAKQSSDVKKISLYVNKMNLGAIQAYKHLGFTETDLPSKSTLGKSCLFMTKTES